MAPGAPSLSGNAPVSKDAYNLLALDGGGVKGISSVLILERIMDRVREIENAAYIQQGRPSDPEERRAVDYFDLAGGTSTGGLIALMLLRLEMRCSEVKPYYDSLAVTLFSPKLGKINLNRLGGFGKFIGDIWLTLKVLAGRPQYSVKPLETEIDKLVGAFPLGLEDRTKRGDTPLVKDGQGQMFVCATLADKGESILLRSYNPSFPALPVSAGARNLDLNAITIKEAARATSAAPTFLKEAVIQGLNF